MKTQTHIIYRLEEHIHLLIFNGSKSEGEVYSVLATGIFTAGKRAGSDTPIEYASEMRRAVLEYCGSRSSEDLAKHIAESMRANEHSN